MDPCEMKQANEHGQAIIEYTFMIVLIAMVVLFVLLMFGPQLGNAFSLITHGL